MLKINNDFDYVLSILPDGWEAKAKELGALLRRKKIPSAEVLFRILMTHLIDGCSLRETSTRMKEASIVDVSDVAIMDRLRSSGEWFRWINQELMSKWVTSKDSSIPQCRYNIKVVDGTRIQEPGPTGSSWCLHYAISLPSFRCSEYSLVEKSKKGETFRNFTPEENDLFLGDRIYGNYKGIDHVVKAGGEVLVRFAWNLLKFLDDQGNTFNLFANLRTLKVGSIGCWNVSITNRSGDHIKGRVCAIRKSAEAAERSLKKVKKTSQRNSSKTQPETYESAGYIMIFTTATDLSPEQVLDIYRFRWQVELVFKRMKSILGLGHLKKIDARSASSWIHGKLLVALLTEILSKYGEDFSP